MSCFPQPHAKRRSPRASSDGITSAVLRLSDGRCIPAKLQVISVTGGLLCLPRPVEPGSRSKARLMFLTRTGSVFGVAEMLTPVSWDLQPFRFVTLHDDDQDRLQGAIQSSLDQSRRADKESRRSQEQIERHRAW